MKTSVSSVLTRVVVSETVPLRGGRRYRGHEEGTGQTAALPAEFLLSVSPPSLYTLGGPVARHRSVVKAESNSLKA